MRHANSIVLWEKPKDFIQYVEAMRKLGRRLGYKVCRIYLMEPTYDEIPFSDLYLIGMTSGKNETGETLYYGKP